MQALSPLVLLHLVVLLFQQLALASVVAVLQLGLPHHLELYSFLDLLAPGGDQVNVAFLPKTIVPPLKVEDGRRPVFLKVVFDFLGALHWFLAFVGRQPVVAVLVVRSVVLELVVVVVGNLRVVEIDDPLQHANFLVLVEQYSCPIPAFAVHLADHIEFLLLFAVVPPQLVQPLPVLLSLRGVLRTVLHQLLQLLLRLLLIVSPVPVVLMRLFLGLNLFDAFELVGLCGAHVFPNRKEGV